MVLMILLGEVVICQETEVESNEFISFSLFQDPAFGFYPVVNGGIGLNENVAFTFYGLFWTQDLLGGNQGGLNLLTEFGVGVSWTLFDGILSLNPSIGLANGNYQSGGGRPIVGDNIVPQFYAVLSAGDFTFTPGFIYWRGLRREARITNFYDQFDYYATAEISLSKTFKAGIYFDHLIFKEMDGKDLENTYTYYFWLGPMAKISINNSTLWFALGVDLVDQFNDELTNDQKIIKDFYKMGFTINL